MVAVGRFENVDTSCVIGLDLSLSTLRSCCTLVILKILDFLVLFDVVGLLVL